MDYADSAILEEAVKAIKKRELMSEGKISLNVMIKQAGLPDGYFMEIAEKVIKIVSEKEVLVLSKDGIDLHFTEEHLLKIGDILSNYIGDCKEYIEGIRWFNKTVKEMNCVIEALKQSKTKAVKRFKNDYLETKKEYYKPLINAELKGRSLFGKISLSFRKIKEKTEKKINTISWVFKIKKAMKKKVVSDYGA